MFLIIYVFDYLCFWLFYYYYKDFNQGIINLSLLTQKNESKNIMNIFYFTRFYYK